MIFEIWDLIPEQERLSNKKNIDQICKIPDRNDINTSRLFEKLTTLGQYSESEKEN